MRGIPETSVVAVGVGNRRVDISVIGVTVGTIWKHNITSPVCTLLLNLLYFHHL